MSILGHDHVTADGNVTIPTDCVYVVALCEGTVNPPYLNGNLMDTKGTVAAQGLLKAISVHVRALPLVEIIPFAMNGADRVTFIYLDDAVCTRPDNVSGFDNSTGEVTGALVTSSTTDIVLGIVIGANGQVVIKGDTVALTLLLDETLVRVGSIVPGDNSLTCLATDEGTLSGYWYTPDPIWVPGTLVTDGYWETVRYTHNITYSAAGFQDGLYIFNKYDNGMLVTTTTSPSPSVPPSYVFYTYSYIWHDPVYSSGYWDYPANQWIETGVSGSVSCIFISIANVMIGANYISRPLIC